MRNTTKTAFSLIEMLLVIAIIMILAGLLYPMFSSMRESARSTRCVSNLRQLQVAAMNFASGGSLPAPVSTLRTNTDIYTGQILSYTHIAGWISWCDHTDGETKPTAGGFTKTYGWLTTDKGVNSIMKGTLWGAAKDRAIYLCPTVALNKSCRTAVRSYSMNAAAGGVSILGLGNTLQVLFGDDGTLPATGTVAGQSQDATHDGSFATNNIWQIHQGKANVVFIDGHIEKR